MAKLKNLFHNKRIVIIAVAVLVLIAVGIAIYFAACAASGDTPADPAGKSSMASLGSGASSEEKTGTSSADIVLSNTESTASADESAAVTSGESSRPLQPVSSTANQTATDTTTTNNANTDTSPASSHTHTWVNHTVQVWVPNIVTVVDQPEQTISGARFYTMHESGEYVADGPTYWFENGFTTEDLKEIIKEGLKNADNNGLYNGVYYGNYQNVTKTIPAVTHEEDQGHYEEKTDYQYCSVCGQRK